MLYKISCSVITQTEHIASKDCVVCITCKMNGGRAAKLLGKLNIN